MKDFINSVVEKLTINMDNAVSVGIVHAATEPVLEFYLGTYKDSKNLTDHIEVFLLFSFH